MKKKTFNTIAEKELVKMLTEKRIALRDFKFAMSGGKTKNVSEGSLIKKDIARILTAISAHKAAAVKA